VRGEVGGVSMFWVSRMLRMFFGGREKVGRWSVVMCWKTNLLHFC
jgi:hypothetical protein